MSHGYGDTVIQRCASRNRNNPVRHITTLKIATKGSCRLGVKYLQVEPGQANPKGEAQQSIQVKRVEKG